MADALLYKQHCRYTRECEDVELHGNEKLHVVCTSKARNADMMLTKLRLKLAGLIDKIVGVDVEYTKYEDPQKATVLQLCVANECLVYHISAAKDRPLQLEEFLMDKRYTFAGFCIKGDKKKLGLCNLVINPDNYVDIHVKWRTPYGSKRYDSLADVASKVIDKFYKDMKKKINADEDHTLWGFCPLPEKLIKYAVIDAYTNYETWNRINTIQLRVERAKHEKMGDGNPYGE